MDSIIFVYNANTGFFNSLTESINKLVAPKKNGCNLCSITHGTFGIKAEWKDFIKSLHEKAEFLHKDEFEKKFPNIKSSFPSVFRRKGKKIKLLISSKEINKTKNLEELKRLVKKS